MSSQTNVAENTQKQPQWGAVWALGIGVASLSSAEMMPSALLTPMASGLKVSEGMAGQSISTTAIVALIVSLLIAPVIGSIDRRKVLLVLSFAQVVSNLVVAFAGNYSTLLAARLLLGVAVGGFWALSASLALRLVSSHEVPKALSIIFGGGAMAGIVAIPLAAAIGAQIGWRGVFIAAAGLAALALTAQLFTLPRMPATGSTRFAHLLDVLKIRQIAIGMACVVLTFGGSQTFAVYLRPFLETITKLDANGVSLALLIIGVSSFLGTSSAAKFLRHDLRITIAGLSLVITLATGLLVVAGRVSVLVFVLLAVFGFARGILAPGWSTWLTRSIPEKAESGGGLLVAFIQVGVMGGAAFGGLITDAAGVVATVTTAGVITLLGAAGVFFWLKN